MLSRISILHLQSLPWRDQVGQRKERSMRIDHQRVGGLVELWAGSGLAVDDHRNAELNPLAPPRLCPSLRHLSLRVFHTEQ